MKGREPSVRQAQATAPARNSRPNGLLQIGEKIKIAKMWNTKWTKSWLSVSGCEDAAAFGREPSPWKAQAGSRPLEKNLHPSCLALQSFYPLKPVLIELPRRHFYHFRPLRHFWLKHRRPRRTLFIWKPSPGQNFAGSKKIRSDNSCVPSAFYLFFTFIFFYFANIFI